MVSMVVDATNEKANPFWPATVGLLILVFIISYVDRQILSLVVGPIKASLKISDFEVGLLQGFAFSMALAVASFVTAPLVDRGNRFRVVGTCMLIWCSMTVICGFAGNFETLLIARTGLAIAEGVVPIAALSIISDVAPRRAVPRAASIFMSGQYIGSGFGLLVGGPLVVWLGHWEGQPTLLFNSFEPWRGLFVALGLPGLAIAIAILLFMREPCRAQVKAEQASLGAFAFLRKNIGLFAPLFAFSVAMTSVNYSLYAWVPTLMIRIHEIGPDTVGAIIGTTFVAAGLGGSGFGAWIMSLGNPAMALSHVVRWMRNLALASMPFFILMTLMPSAELAFVAFLIGFFMMAACISAIFTPQQLCAPAHLRARVTAVSGLLCAGLGGLGPLAVGAITDFIFGSPAYLAWSLTTTFTVAWLIMLVTAPMATRAATRFDQG
jgi:MFS family permease